MGIGLGPELEPEPKLEEVPGVSKVEQATVPIPSILETARHQ